jgi:hypothetical protein
LEEIKVLPQFDLNRRLHMHLENEKQVPNYRPDIPIDIQLRGENDKQIYYRLRRLIKEGINIFEILHYRTDTFIGYFVLITWYELYSPDERLPVRSLIKVFFSNIEELYRCLLAALKKLGIDTVPAKWDIK